jgi:hypothetical protein
MNRLTSVLRDEDAKTDTFGYYQDGEMSAAHYGNNSRNVTYNLDLAGNRTSVIDGNTTSYISNNLNQYTTVGGVNPQYIPAHAMSAFGSQSYHYIGDTFLARSFVSPNDLYLYYDALGRCMKRKLNGVSNYRVFQGEHWIAEYTASNVNIGTAIYGNGVDEMIARGYNGVPYWYFPDRNGNMSVVLNTAGGVLESYRYDALARRAFLIPPVNRSRSPQSATRFFLPVANGTTPSACTSIAHEATIPTSGVSSARIPRDSMRMSTIYIAIVATIHSTRRIPPAQSRK